MKIKERILLETRYIISLNKKIKDLVPLFNVSQQTIYHDINYKLKKVDNELYYRVMHILNNN